MHIHYIKDEYNGSYRIWRSDNPGDAFDLVHISDFEPNVLKFVERFPALFVADFPEDDSGEVVCVLCKAEAKTLVHKSVRK